MNVSESDIPCSLEKGNLEHHADNKVQDREYCIRLLDESYLDQVEALQKEVIACISEPNLFAACSRERIMAALTTEGRIVGTCVGGELAGYVLIYFPGENPENLGNDLHLPAPELMSVAHLESGVVHPSYRGNNLALKMNRHAIYTVQKMKFKHVCATAWPFNQRSVPVLFSLGMVVRGLKEKYGGKLRYIFHRNLYEPLFHPAGEPLSIEIGSWDAQLQAMAEGKVGYASEERDGKRAILFSRKAPLHL